MTRTRFYVKAARSLIANDDCLDAARRYLSLVKRWKVLRRAVKAGGTDKTHLETNRRERRDLERTMYDALEKYVRRRFMAIIPRSALEKSLSWPTSKRKSVTLSRNGAYLLLNGKVVFQGSGSGSGAVVINRADLLDLISRRGEVLLIDCQANHWIGWHSWAENNKIKSGEPLLYAYAGQQAPRANSERRRAQWR